MENLVGFVTQKLNKEVPVEEEAKLIKVMIDKTREFILTKAVHSLGPSHFTNILIADTDVNYSTSSGNICCYDMTTIEIVDDSFFPFSIDKFMIDGTLLGIASGHEFKLFSYPDYKSLQSAPIEVVELQPGIYSASRCGKIHHWSADESTLLYDYHEPISSFRLTAKGLFLLGKSLKVVEISTNSELYSREKAFKAFEVSDEHLALLYDDGVEVVSLHSFEIVNHIKQSKPVCLSLSAASDFLAVGFEDHLIRVFDLTQGREEILMRGHSGKILQVKISPCTNFIASISEDLYLKVWSFPDFPHETIIHSSSKVSLIYFHGAHLIVCKGDNKVYSYSETLEELFEMKSSAMSAATFNTFLLVGDEIGFVYLFDMQNKALVLNIKAHNGAVRGLAINEKKVITGGADSEIYIWNVFEQLGSNLDVTSKKKLIGHQQAIWKIEICDQVLISGSSDNTIRLWELETLNEIGRINSTISAMAVGDELVTGNFDGELRFWNLYDLNLESMIPVHSRVVTGISCVKNLIFSSSNDGNVVITSAKYRVVYSKVAIKDAILSFFVNEKYIIIGCKNKMVIKNNLFFDETLRIIGPADLIQNFLLYIKELFLRRNPKHNPTMDQFLILPYFINTLHIYTYLGLSNFLTISLENFSPLIANPFSPLCYSVYCDLKAIRGVLLNNIIQAGELNPYIFKLAEPHLVKMNEQGLDEVYELYEAAYMQVNRKYLPKTCSKEVKLPITKSNLYQRIQKEDFFTDEDLCEGVPLLYKENYLGIHMYLGSTKSLEFIDSLVKCPNPQILRAAFIQDMVKYKWEAARFPMYIQTWMYYFYIVTLSIYMQWFKRDLYCLSVLMFTNLLLTLYEVFQMMVFKKYFSSVWNYLDWIRSFLFYGYAVTEFMILFNKDPKNTSDNSQSSVDDYILELLLVASCIRGISYFRIFELTRYLIRLLQESIEGILGYLVFFSYFIMGFSMINFVNDISKTEMPSKVGEIYQTYELTLGSFYKNQEYDVTQWTLLTLISLILCIIIFNIMISLIGDSFEKVQTNSLSADTQELLEMIFEVENMMVTRRHRNDIYYFHFVDNYFKDQVDSWEGRVRLIIKCLERMSLKQRKQMTELNYEFDKKTKTAVALERKLEKIAKVFVPSKK